MVSKAESDEEHTKQVSDAMDRYKLIWFKRVSSLLDELDDDLYRIMDKADPVEFAGAQYGILQACATYASRAAVSIMSVLQPAARNPEVSALIGEKITEETIKLLKGAATTEIIKASSLDDAKRKIQEHIARKEQEQHGTGEETERRD